MRGLAFRKRLLTNNACKERKQKSKETEDKTHTAVSGLISSKIH